MPKRKKTRRKPRRKSKRTPSTKARQSARKQKSPTTPVKKLNKTEKTRKETERSRRKEVSVSAMVAMVLAGMLFVVAIFGGIEIYQTSKERELKRSLKYEVDKAEDFLTGAEEVGLYVDLHKEVLDEAKFVKCGCDRDDMEVALVMVEELNDALNNDLLDFQEKLDSEKGKVLAKVAKKLEKAEDLGLSVEEEEKEYNSLSNENSLPRLTLAIRDAKNLDLSLEEQIEEMSNG